MPTKPKIFIPEEGNNTLIDVLLEQYDDFDIYWYHWPQDGYVFWVEDYEPVIIVYKGDEICYLITRRHWSYKFYTADEGLKIPLEVLFDGEFHPPYQTNYFQISMILSKSEVENFLILTWFIVY